MTEPDVKAGVFARTEFVTEKTSANKRKEKATGNNLRIAKALTGQ
jgi:hypothetical protein